MSARLQSRSSLQNHRRLHAALERQARAIGQFLHDEAGQLLAAAYIALAEASHDLPSPASERLSIVKRHLASIEECLHDVARELNPRLLDECGFAAALEFLARGFTARHSIRTDVHLKVPRRFPEPVATTLYRVAQEGLSNIGRHAQATRASIRVAPAAGSVRCTIRDNGVGFDAAAVARRDGAELGLRCIRDRLETVGGELTIKSAYGVGTELIATVPLDV